MTASEDEEVVVKITNSTTQRNKCSIEKQQDIFTYPKSMPQIQWISKDSHLRKQIASLTKTFFWT